MSYANVRMLLYLVLVFFLCLKVQVLTKEKIKRDIVMCSDDKFKEQAYLKQVEHQILIILVTNPPYPSSGYQITNLIVVSSFSAITPAS